MTAPLSLGSTTDLAILAATGSIIEERDASVVVRTPLNPTYHWGNCLILREPPPPGSLAHWLDVFGREHPLARHVAIGVGGRVDFDPAELQALDLESQRDLVLTATRPPSAAPPPEGYVLRHLDPEDDAAWSQLVDSEMSDAETSGEVAGSLQTHRQFLERRYDAYRNGVRAGLGSWCAAVRDDGTAAASLGVFRAGDGVARYQSVFTHPQDRRRGLAAALVAFAGEYAVSELAARTLVIVADPAGPAIGIYRGCGFADREHQSALYRPGE